MKTLGRIMSDLAIEAVLVDVGASGAPLQIWEPIAPCSIYVGFDPDLRDLRELPEGRFRRGIIVNEAVAADPSNGEVPFYLTSSPYCSSTLKPDHESLSHYLFSKLFTVEAQERVKVTSLNSVLEKLSLDRLDWLKTDSQGTDLRIFQSLRPEVRSRVLAVDMEPGLIDAYLGEDLFVRAHEELTASGFWLSDLQVHGAVRMKRSTAEDIEAQVGASRGLLESVVKPSPGWVEARYLRTLEHLSALGASSRDYILLGVFALLDGQLGFALDLVLEYERLFGRDGASELLREYPMEMVKRAGRGRLAKNLGVRISREIKRRLP